MLRVKIELLPFDSQLIENSWNMDIWNDGSGTLSSGNYSFRIFEKNSNNAICKSGEIKNFSRLKDGVWYLLYLCLKKIYNQGE